MHLEVTEEPGGPAAAKLEAGPSQCSKYVERKRDEGGKANRRGDDGEGSGSGVQAPEAAFHLDAPGSQEEVQIAKSWQTRERIVDDRE